MYHFLPSKKTPIVKSLLFAALLLMQTSLFAQTYNAGPMYVSGTVYVGTSAGGQEDLTNALTGDYRNAGDFYLTGNFTNNQTAAMIIPGTSTGAIHFIGNNTTLINGTSAGGFNTYGFEINKGSTTTRVDMTTQSVVVDHNINLTQGIVTTGSNLFTWGNTGTLTAPEPTFTLNSLNYTKSFIATCNAAGIPQTGGANATTPFTGNVGMKIKNVTNTNTYFPVGVSYLPAGTSISTPAPNRMMLNNQYGTPEDYTVTLEYADIGYTPGGTPPAANRVNVVWYVKTSAPADAGKATMQLFYTKRNTVLWPVNEGEVESGFDYAQGAIVQKDYSGSGNVFVNLSSGGDIQSMVANNVNTEAYATYTIGVSVDPPPAVTKSGIVVFNRFSIVNPTGIILPVSIINFKAYQQGTDVETEWTCVNEKNMDHYEVERSNNGTNFSTIGSVAALDNGKPSVSYNFLDIHPANGNNFYRIKAIGKDGSLSYTNIQVVYFGGGAPGVMIFPNPVTAYNFTLQMNNMPGGKYALLIHNMLGQLVVSQQIERLEGSSSQTIYLPAGTARGVYKVSLINGTTRIIKTITVQ